MKGSVFVTMVVSLLFINYSFTQTIWNGPSISFAKEGGADFTSEENQDRITDNVWITRGNTQGIFNIKSESSYVSGSPSDTEWAFGTTADIASLSFETWVDAVQSNPPGNLNRDMVLHLISENIFIDIKFTTWGVGSNGGGSFSYIRSTEMVSGIFENEISRQITVFPNPCSDFLIVRTENPDENEFRIISINGEKFIYEGSYTGEIRIDTRKWLLGIYLLIPEKGDVVKFVKD